MALAFRIFATAVVMYHFAAMATGSHCQNGGTYDDVNYICTCTPFFHGTQCQTSFSDENPCDSTSHKISDPFGVHRPSNIEECSGSACVDMSDFTPGWYEIDSPAGNDLVESDTCLGSGVVCGASTAYVLRQKTTEENNNLQLFKGLALKHDTRRDSCFSSADASFPVRILRCSAQKTLYFLLPLLSSKHHYCIGSKQSCPSGFVSIDGSGFEPCTNDTCTPMRAQNFTKPQLQIQSVIKSRHMVDRNFFCTVHDSFRSNFSGGVTYQVSYLFTFKSGTKVLLNQNGCTTSNLTINQGEKSNATFCAGDSFFNSGAIKSENVLGGTLQCLVQARCNIEGAEFNSEILYSNPHRFVFNYRYVSVNTSHETKSISPTEPVNLCISSTDIPSPGVASFHLSVATGKSIDVAVLKMNNETSDESDSPATELVANENQPQCGAEQYHLKSEKELCITLVTYNFDLDNARPTNMPSYTSAVKVNISMSSSSDGLNTNGKSLLIESVDLIVNLTSIYTNVTDFMHIYTDPVVKPAHLSHDNLFWAGRYGDLLVLKHKLYDYEIQVQILGDVSELWIRYHKYTMIIRGSSSTRTLQYVAPTQESDSLIPLIDGVPRGVSIDGEGTMAMTVKLELYGTLIYVWGFVTFRWDFDFNCRNQFVQSRASIASFQSICTKPNHVIEIGDDHLAMDLMVVPGFHDIPEWVEGAIYANNGQEVNANFFKPSKSSSRSMFSPSYTYELHGTIGGVPASQVVSLCRCGSSASENSCAYNTQRVITRRRKKRSLTDSPVASKNSATTTPSPTSPSTSRNVTEAEAKETCAQMLQEKIELMSTGIRTCSNTSGILGQSDFITQFSAVCVEYAKTLGTFAYSEQLLNSFLGMCVDAISRDETVPEALKQQTVTNISAEVCPGGCSGNGVCSLGSCLCNAGFKGVQCQILTNATTTATTTGTTPCPSTLPIVIGVVVAVVGVLAVFVIVTLVVNSTKAKKKKKNVKDDFDFDEIRDGAEAEG